MATTPKQNAKTAAEDATKAILVKVPAEMHSKVKLLAAVRGTSVQDFVSGLLAEKLASVKISVTES